MPVKHLPFLDPYASLLFRGNNSAILSKYARLALKRDANEQTLACADPMEVLAKELFLSEEWLRHTVKLLHDKGQSSLQHARHRQGLRWPTLPDLVARGSALEKLQFHLSYACEDVGAAVPRVPKPNRQVGTRRDGT